MNPDTTAQAAHPFEKLFDSSPTLLIYIETGCIEALPNLLAAHFLRLLLFYWLKKNLRAFGSYNLRQGFVVCATVHDIMLALQVVTVVQEGFIPDGTEIAWWDPSELIVREHISPNGLPFERLVPEIMAAHQHFLALPPA